MLHPKSEAFPPAIQVNVVTSDDRDTVPDGSQLGLDPESDVFDANLMQTFVSLTKSICSQSGVPLNTLASLDPYKPELSFGIAAAALRNVVSHLEMDRPQSHVTPSNQTRLVGDHSPGNSSITNYSLFSIRGLSPTPYKPGETSSRPNANTRHYPPTNHEHSRNLEEKWCQENVAGSSPGRFLGTPTKQLKRISAHIQGHESSSFRSSIPIGDVQSIPSTTTNREKFSDWKEALKSPLFVNSGDKSERIRLRDKVVGPSPMPPNCKQKTLPSMKAGQVDQNPDSEKTYVSGASTIVRLEKFFGGEHLDISDDFLQGIDYNEVPEEVNVGAEKLVPLTQSKYWKDRLCLDCNSTGASTRESTKALHAQASRRKHIVKKDSSGPNSNNSTLTRMRNWKNVETSLGKLDNASRTSGSNNETLDVINNRKVKRGAPVDSRKRLGVTIMNTNGSLQYRRQQMIFVPAPLDFEITSAVEPPTYENSILVAADSFYNKSPFSHTWKLGKKIGKGSSATVYLASTERNHNKSVGISSSSCPSEQITAAVKVLCRDSEFYSIEKACQEIFCLRLVQEAGGHKNVVRLYEVFEDINHIYIVMEALLGGELLPRLTNALKYSERDVAKLAVSMLSATAFCHRLNMVHRDLKAENFVFSVDGDGQLELKLTDFGITYFSTDANSVCYAMTGSPLYLAPEVFHRQPYSYAVDLWSLGVLMYIMLAGYPPFEAENVLELAHNTMYCGVKCEGPEWEMLSPEAVDFVHSLLQRDPSLRTPAVYALKHVWLQNDCQAAGSNNLEAALERLKESFGSNGQPEFGTH